MPEVAIPPVAPVAPPPATPPPAAPDPPAPPTYVPLSPENDADHQLKQMVSRRRKPEAPPAEPVPPAAAAPAPPAEPPKPDQKPAAGFNEAVGKVFGWKPGKKPDAAPAADPAPPAAPAAPAAPAEPPAAPPKTIVSKKKAAPAPPAAPNITEITEAATTAAVRALHGAPKGDVPTQKPEEALSPEDRHDFEVAGKLAEINPKYKDAPKVILEHVKKSEAYAARWETANPGKHFDPDDDEHNEFFESIEKPWSDHEFRTAEIEMAATRVAEKTTRHSDSKIKALEQDNARLELNPIVERTFVSAAGHMARQLEVYDKLGATNGDFSKFQEEDPITAEAMGAALGPIQPLIEAIVQIDDPKGRFPVDVKNPTHQAWLQLLAEKEAQYAGTEADGKMFATRIEYARMNDAQRARHWYLTPDHLVSEVVNDAITSASERVKTEKERQKKIALSLGYVPAGEIKAGAPKSPATNGAATPPEPPPQPAAAKPVSPSVGSGAKIDAKGSSTPTGRAATMAAIGDILFRPGNAVP